MKLENCKCEPGNTHSIKVEKDGREGRIFVCKKCGNLCLDNVEVNLLKETRC